MKKIKDIYKEYKIMPNLAMHQMRVAAVAMQICESLDIEIDTESVAKACLLHDMGNIIKSNLKYFPEWNEPEGIEYWEGVKEEFIEKYGKDEHVATLLILKELNASPYMYNLISSVDDSYLEDILSSLDVSRKIYFYADNRVTPHGVASLEERNDEVKERYKDHPAFAEETLLPYLNNLKELEKQVFSYSKIKPEGVNDESVKKYLEKLQDFSI